jgi:DNA-binding transcriptional regulator YiaG
VRRKKRYKRKPFKPIDCEDFRMIRLTNHLSVERAASLLQVTPRTVAHWESGCTRIPYSAYKLLRCLANGELVPDTWKGWRIIDDTLWSPTGRPFKVYELTYLSNYFTMARYWLRDCELKKGNNQSPLPGQFTELPKLKLIKGGLQ